MGKIVCDVPVNENVFLRATMWDVRTNGNVSGDWLCGMYLRPETILLYNCIFFSSTLRISIFKRSPVAHDLILPNVCARRAYPRRFMGRVGRTPLSPTLTRRQFQMSSRKGVKNRLYSTDAYQWYIYIYIHMHCQPNPHSVWGFLVRKHGATSKLFHCVFKTHLSIHMFGPHACRRWLS